MSDQDLLKKDTARLSIMAARQVMGTTPDLDRVPVPVQNLAGSVLGTMVAMVTANVHALVERLEAERAERKALERRLAALEARLAQ